MLVTSFEDDNAVVGATEFDDSGEEDQPISGDQEGEGFHLELQQGGDRNLMMTQHVELVVLRCRLPTTQQTQHLMQHSHFP
eukprot:COSAG02_NODE_8278_length_2633_cov_2.093923_1_plen_81_part_00